MPQAFNYKRIVTTGVSTISISQMGQLHGVVVNQQSTAAASTSLMSLYDSTTTTNTANLIGVGTLNNSGVSDYIYDAITANGLTINIAGGANPVDITVLFT